MREFAGLKLHPNGFLGAPIEFREPRIKKPVQIDLIGTASRRITLESDEASITPNREIDELFKEAASHEDLMGRDFMFRERILRATLQAFGTITINDWILRQKANPYFDSMQNRFVEETVGFVYTGFRKYHPSVYMDTLDMGTHNAFAIGPSVRSHLMNNPTQPETTITEFVQQWLSRPGGTADLLFSIRILFGS